MDFAQQQRNPSRHLFGVGGVVLLHVLIVYALVSGLARKVVEVVKGPIDVKVIEEVIKKPPPPPEVVPPPPKMQAPPPPFIPPPEVVIANPPFSLKNWGADTWAADPRAICAVPPAGNADLAWVQHMIASMTPGTGRVGVVMPHGVLFRGGAEKEIRKKFLEQDLIEAIIGLPQNLFYGAGIPACILIMRPNLTGQAANANKPTDRQSKVLFINADAEFHAGRAQNYLRPEHVEKIVSTFDRYQDVPGYARVVPLAEIASEANDFNLNIRRYVDNTPPPEPHDVRASPVWRRAGGRSRGSAPAL